MDVVLRSEREDWMCEAVKNDIGVSVMPINLALHAGLDYVPIKENNFERSIEVITVAGREKRPVIQKLIDHFIIIIGLLNKMRCKKFGYLF